MPYNMKVSHYDEDETLYKFTVTEKKNQSYSDMSLSKRGKSSSFIVPTSNTKLLNSSRNELVKDDTALTVLNALICTLSIFQHNLFFSNNYSLTEFISKVRMVIVGVALSSALWIVRRYQVQLVMKLSRFQVSTGDSLWSTKLYRSMLLELLFAFVVLPPYTDYTFSVQMLGFTVEYSLSVVLTFVSILKMYVVFRLFGHYSEYTQNRAQVICKKHSVATDAYFALKCYLHDSPFIGIAIFFIGMSCFCSFTMQLSEEPDRDISGKMITSSLSAFWDNLWTILYTTTTVGYGNLYPVTHLGRAMCILACVLGNMYLGMLIISVHQTVALDDSQTLAYAWISRGCYSRASKSLARAAVRKAVTLYLLSKKWKKTISRIKPNGIVTYKNVTLNNDLCSLTEKQYMIKLRLYKELKKLLKQFKELNKSAREVGKSEIDAIFEFEDAVRVEFPSVVKRLKRTMQKEDVEASQRFVKACEPLERRMEKVKDFSKNLRKKFGQVLRRKTMVLMNERAFVRSSTRVSDGLSPGKLLFY